jgi:phage gpG-like protein
LLSHVKADKLSDQVLRVSTGRLRRSITQEVQIESEKIIGIVGTNVEYARAHEYGYTGAVTVKSHIRRLKTGKETNVRSYSRNANIKERSFLRSALSDMESKITEDIQAALISAAKEGIKK